MGFRVTPTFEPLLYNFTSNTASSALLRVTNESWVLRVRFASTSSVTRLEVAPLTVLAQRQS